MLQLFLKTLPTVVTQFVSLPWKVTKQKDEGQIQKRISSPNIANQEFSHESFTKSCIETLLVKIKTKVHLIESL